MGRVYIRRGVELLAYEYTYGCAGCESARLDQPPKPHTQACRDRIELALARDDVAKARLARADDRRCGLRGGAGTTIAPMVLDREAGGAPRSPRSSPAKRRNVLDEAGPRVPGAAGSSNDPPRRDPLAPQEVAAAQKRSADVAVGDADEGRDRALPGDNESVPDGNEMDQYGQGTRKRRADVTTEDADVDRDRALPGDGDSEDGSGDGVGIDNVAVALGVCAPNGKNTVHEGLLMDLAEVCADGFYCEVAAALAQAAVDEQQPLVILGCALCKDVSDLIGSEAAPERNEEYEHHAATPRKLYNRQAGQGRFFIDELGVLDAGMRTYTQMLFDMGASLVDDSFWF